MDNQLLLKQISELPDKAKEEMILFLESLVRKYQLKSVRNEKRSGFGSLQGIQIANDFNADLEDFKEYMPE